MGDRRQGQDTTQLLQAWGEGDDEARDQLMLRVYDELRWLARRQFAREDSGHTLQPTAVVNEAFLRLIDQRQVPSQNRAQFFAVASRLMRRILVDHARKRDATKRKPVTLPSPESSLLGQVDIEVLDLHRALERLAQIDPRQCTVVELRYFGGLTSSEIAELIGTSERTVRTDWRMARGWLASELELRRTAHRLGSIGQYVARQHPNRLPLASPDALSKYQDLI